MRAIELQSKDGLSKKEKLLFPHDSNSNFISKLKSKKVLLIISISIILIITIILIIVFSTKSSSDKNKEETPINNNDNIKTKYKKEDFYSTKTNNYYNLINNLEKENSIYIIGI